MKWLAAGVAMVAACLVGVSSPAAAVPGGCDPNFEVVDHRGALKERDENTLPAIRVGARRGESIEIDVRATSDGMLILMHDPRIDRTTTGSGLVSELTFEQIRSVRTKPGGEFVPTLDQALNVAGPYGIDVYLDVKDGSDEVLLKSIDAIREHAMTNRVLVTSWTGKMVRLTRGNPDILLQHKPDGDAPDDDKINYYVRNGMDSVSLFPRQMSHELVDRLRLEGIEVHSRLVSKEQAWDRVTQYQIQGALTNRPRLLTEYCSPPPS